MESPAAKSPFEIRNVRLFIAFRVFFNCRFYYPVFTILFLDFGLTLEQFAILNAAWAAAIVLLEVPSGALADIIGRRKLLITTGLFMVFEMALLCFASRSNLSLLFTIFLINRVISGAAEASASGADEAIAYDSLKIEGDASHWPRVLEKQMRIQSIVYVGAMSLGAAVYDPAFMQRAAYWLGLDVRLTQDITLRFPLYLTLIMAILTLLTTLRMHEGRTSNNEHSSYEPFGKSIIRALKLTLKASHWILKTPFALVIIFAGLLFDNCLRLVITLISQYYRLISLPEASFGLIGSGFALLGLIIPKLALRMVQSNTPVFNLCVMTIFTILGLIGMTFFWPIAGLLPVILTRIVMYLQFFFQSHYLNRITSSQQRATVLSFKGLTFNLAYGLIGILYSFLLVMLRPQVSLNHPNLSMESLENLVFMKSLSWFPWYFVVMMVALFLFARWQLRHSVEHKIPG